MKKFCIYLLVAVVAFVSSTARSNVSFNATTINTNSTMAPFVLNETLPTTTTTTTVSIDFSFDIQPDEAMNLIQNVSANCHEVYKNYVVPFAMDISRVVYEMYLPVAKDRFNTIWAEIYKKIASFATEKSVSYALFGFGRVPMMAVPFESIDNHSISFIQTVDAPLVIVANVSGVGNLDEMKVEKDSKNVTEFVSVARKDNIVMLTDTASAHLQANITSSLMVMDDVRKNNKTFPTIARVTASTTSNNTSETTASPKDIKWSMVFHENSTPTFAKATTPSDSLLDDFSAIPLIAFDLANAVFEALCECWEAFYKECQSLFPSFMVLEE